LAQRTIEPHEGRCCFCDADCHRLFDLAWHVRLHHQDAVVAGKKLKEGSVKDNLGQPITFLECWCGEIIDRLADHLEARGGLAAHILEITLGTNDQAD
jgi:hypothetical protein